MRLPSRLNRFRPEQKGRALNCKPGAWLYLITDGQLPGSDTTANLLKRTEGALRGGVRLVQLREKSLTEAELLTVALKLRELTSAYRAGLIINNSIEVALKCGADGVHLPQAGLCVNAAREALDAGALIGLSTHSIEEAKKAQKEGADFITFGPVYFTKSKARYGEPVGIKRLEEAAKQVNIPLFGLGGIGPAQVEEVLEAGAAGIGLISAILSRHDTQKATEQIMRLL